MPWDASASTTVCDSGKLGRIFLSQLATGAGISILGAPVIGIASLSSKEGKASRWTRDKKMASMTMVVRRHFLSRPLRRMVDNRGMSIRQVKWESRMRGPAAQTAHSKLTVCKKSSGKAVFEVGLAKTC